MRTSLSLALLLVTACGGAPHQPTTPERVVDIEEMRIVASRGDDGGFSFESYDASTLFEQGTRLLGEGRCQDAVEQFYDRLVREFPTSRYRSPAQYNAAVCLHEGGQLEASVPYYQAVIAEAAEGDDARHAALQLAGALVALERHEDALRVSTRLLLREDLQSHERLEGLARRAQALFGLERVEEAERQARDALSFFRTRRGEDVVRDPYFAAAANFVLAESIRARAEAIELPPGSALEQHEQLEARSRLVLDAQREYFNTIRHTEAEWAAASGYRIGAMYDRFWEALMSAPVPPPERELNDDLMPIYEEEYRAELARQIRPLLQHAIRYWELTLLMVERTGVRSDWTERTREDLERMRNRLLAHDDEDGESSDDEAGSGEPVSRLIPTPATLLSQAGAPSARALLRDAPGAAPLRAARVNERVGTRSARSTPTGGGSRLTARPASRT